MDVSNVMTGSTTNPDIFGPALWFTLHNSAVVYPRKPTEYIRSGMKNILINLPLIIPCVNCKEHFYDFVHRADLDKAVSSRENLFSFWVDVHNYVNRRYRRPEMSLVDAKRLYGFDTPERGATMRITYNR
jgi:hypothetical protein